MKENLLDPDAVKRERTRLGIATHVLSRSLGVATAVIDRIERGADQSKLTVGFVTTLASALGVTVRELGVEHHIPSPQCDPDRIDSTDPAQVGALLAGNGRLAAVDALASALGWSLQRTVLALEALAVLLDPAGQRVAWVGSTHVAVRAAPVDEAKAEVVGRRSFADTGLNRDEALVVHRVLSNKTMSTTATNPVSVRRLHAATFLDYVETDARGRANRAVLTDAALYNLVLDAK